MRRRLPSAGLQPCRRRKRWCTPNTAPTKTTTQPTTTRTPRQSHGRTAPRTGRSEPTARPSCSRPPSASASGPRTRCSSRRPSGTRAWRSCCSRSSRAGAPSHTTLAFTLTPTAVTHTSISLTLSHCGQARAHSLCLGLRRGGGARPHRARAPRVDRRERRRQLAELRGHVDGAAQASSSKHYTDCSGTDTTSAPRLHRLLTACSPAPSSRAFGAILHKTEMQLRYFPSNSSITDMSISLAGVKLHVDSEVLTMAQRAFVSASGLSGTAFVSARSRLRLTGSSASLGQSAGWAERAGRLYLLRPYQAWFRHA